MWTICSGFVEDNDFGEAVDYSWMEPDSVRQESDLCKKGLEPVSWVLDWEVKVVVCFPKASGCGMKVSESETDQVD